MIRIVDCIVLFYNRGEFFVYGGYYVFRECGVDFVWGIVYVGGGVVCGVNGFYVNFVIC